MMYSNFLTIGWRNLLKNKTLSIINILGLAVGLTCASIAFLYVHFENTYDTHHSKADRIYRVVEHQVYANNTFLMSTTAFPLAPALRQDFADIEAVTQTCGPVERIISVELGQRTSRFKEKRLIYTDPDFFRVFDYEWLAGNPETALTDINSIVLTSSIATKYFGETLPHDIIGRTVMMGRNEILTVTGVLADPPSNSSLLFSMLVPFKLYVKQDPYRANNWSGNYNGTTLIVLSDKQSKEELERSIHHWKGKYLNEEDNQRKSYELQPLNEVHTDKRYASTPGSYTIDWKYLFAAQTVGVFILILACINFVNLTTAYASTRMKEVGIRKTLGGLRSQLIGQFLIENLMLSTIAIVLSLTAIQLAVQLLNNTFNEINLSLEVNGKFILITVLFGILVSTIAGLYPAYITSGYRATVTADREGTKIKSLNLRRVLVVFQFIIVQVMIIGTAVVAFQMNFIRDKDLGFDERNVITVPITNSPALDHLRQSLTALSGISDLTYSSDPPTSTFRSYGTNARLPNQKEADGISAEMKCVDTDYLEFYNLELIAGRNFTHVSERFDQFIVNEKLLKAFGWSPEEAVGKSLQINEGQAVIIGVVRDFHNNSLQSEITPCILMNWNLLFATANIKYASAQANLGQTIDLIETPWKQAHPNGVFEYTLLDTFLADDYRQEQLVYAGFVVFSAIAIFIGCLGLFGMIQFMALQRTKEIGIRKILGASTFKLVRLLSNELFRLVFIGFCIASPLGYYFMSDWLHEFAYHIEISWEVYLLTGLGSIVLTAGTISYQTMKTAMANPVEALRYE